MNNSGRRAVPANAPARARQARREHGRSAAGPAKQCPVGAFRNAFQIGSSHELMAALGFRVGADRCEAACDAGPGFEMVQFEAVRQQALSRVEGAQDFGGSPKHGELVGG